MPCAPCAMRRLSDELPSLEASLGGPRAPGCVCTILTERPIWRGAPHGGAVLAAALAHGLEASRPAAIPQLLQVDVQHDGHRVPRGALQLEMDLNSFNISSYSIVLFSSRSSAAASPAAGNKKPYSRRTPADDSERIWKWLQGWMPRRRLTAHIFRSLVRLSIE